MHCSINQSDSRTACCQIHVPISVLEVNKNLSTKVFKMAGLNVPNRLHSTSESEINFFKDKPRNQNTENSTNTWVNAFKEWAKSRQKNDNIASYQPEDLDRILQVFYVEVRKRNKEEYEPECLRVMRAGLERHLKERNYLKRARKFLKVKLAPYETLERGIVQTEQELSLSMRKRPYGTVVNLVTNLLEPLTTPCGFI